MPGRDASELVFHRQPSVFRENLSGRHFQLQTGGFQRIPIHQPITGHFRQKGARRYLPDLEPSRAFGSGLKIQTEKPGVFNNPFSDQPGVGTSMPISNWIGIADGLQAILNSSASIRFEDMVTKVTTPENQMQTLDLKITLTLNLIIHLSKSFSNAHTNLLDSDRRRNSAERG